MDPEAPKLMEEEEEGTPSNNNNNPEVDTKDEDAVSITTTRCYYWRPWCKVVAYLDLGLLVLGLSFAFVATFMGVAIPAGSIERPPLFKDDDDDENEKKKHPIDSMEKMFVAFALTVVLGLTCMGFWAALKLINATEIARSPRDRLALARMWKNVNIAFIAFATLGLFYNQTSIICAINLMWHTVLLLIVGQYINELEAAEMAEKENEEGKNEEKQTFGMEGKMSVAAAGAGNEPTEVVVVAIVANEMATGKGKAKTEEV